MSALADQLKGGGKFLRWADIGQGVIVSGTVTSIEVRQDTEFDKPDLAFWSDGSPKMIALIGMDTALRDPGDSEDTGDRTLTVNLWSGQKRALRDACRAAGVSEPSQGDTLEAVWTAGAGNAKDPRVFAYRIIKGSGLGSVLAAPTIKAPASDPWATALIPVAAPVAAPTPPPVAVAPVAPANPVEAAKDLLRAGLSQADVAAATGYSPAVVAALANQL